MGHVVFVILHIVALLAFGVGLLVTIPAHLIYAAIRSRGAKPPAPVVFPDRPTPATHVRCPECKELVLKDATLCKHCHTKLVPVS